MERTEKYISDIELLFQEWKNKAPSDDINHSKNVFIRDGIVCPERWFSQKVRPLISAQRSISRNRRLGFNKGSFANQRKNGKAHYMEKGISMDARTTTYINHLFMPV